MNPWQEVRTRQMAHSSKDQNDPPVPWCSVFSVGAHLLLFSRLPVTPAFSGPLSRLTCHYLCPRQPFSPCFTCLASPARRSPFQSHLPDPSPDLTGLGPLPLLHSTSPPTLLQDTVYIYLCDFWLTLPTPWSRHSLKARTPCLLCLSDIYGAGRTFW